MRVTFFFPYFFFHYLFFIRVFYTCMIAIFFFHFIFFFSLFALIIYNSFNFFPFNFFSLNFLFCRAFKFLIFEKYSRRIFSFQCCWFLKTFFLIQEFNILSFFLLILWTGKKYYIFLFLDKILFNEIKDKIILFFAKFNLFFFIVTENKMYVYIHLFFQIYLITLKKILITLNQFI